MKRKYKLKDKHLTKYEKNIESLMALAEKEARLKVTNIGKAGELRPGFGGRTYFHCFFTEHFHRAINRLAVENGYRSF